MGFFPPPLPYPYVGGEDVNLPHFCSWRLERRRVDGEGLLLFLVSTRNEDDIGCIRSKAHVHQDYSKGIQGSSRKGQGTHGTWLGKVGSQEAPKDSS